MSDTNEIDDILERAALDPDTPLLLADFVDAPTSRNEFRTATRTAPNVLPSVPTALQSPTLNIVPVEKTARNPYEAFVFVGRASTCDVIFRDVSVSKSHAVFERATDGWYLKDNRSHNGTFIGDRRLAAGERALVRSGDALRFGAYPVYFMMPDDLRRILGPT